MVHSRKCGQASSAKGLFDQSWLHLDKREPLTRVLERFDLDTRKKGRAYSKGNRQKVALVAALASDVELLILDEPTAGLDPLMESVFRECIEELRWHVLTASL